MKRNLGLLLLLLLSTSPGWAQVNLYTNGSITCSASGGGSGTVNPGTLNQIAFYPGAGTAVSGTSSVTGITLDGLDPTHVGYLLNLTSDAQAQLNAKQAALTLTTTGSGAATLSGGALNIPTPPAAIANIQISTGTTLIAAHTCTANTATAMTGLLTTSAIISPTPTSSTTGVTGWTGSAPALGFNYYVAAGTFNWSVCNSDPTNPVTPGSSITWNVGAR